MRKKGSKTTKRMKEEEIEKGDCGPPTRSLFFFRFCQTWTMRYQITSQTRVKRVSRIHHQTIYRGSPLWRKWAEQCFSDCLELIHSDSLLDISWHASKHSSFMSKPQMNGSEASCCSAEVPERHRSVCNFERLAVWPVSCNFHTFIPPYLKKNWRDDARKLSIGRDMVMLTQTWEGMKTATGSSEAWFFFFSFGFSSPKRN